MSPGTRGLTSSALMLVSLFSCSGGQSGKKTSFVETCEQVQMVYHLLDGKRDADTVLRCISPDRPRLPDGYSDGFLESRGWHP